MTTASEKLNFEELPNLVDQHGAILETPGPILEAPGSILEVGASFWWPWDSILGSPGA